MRIDAHQHFWRYTEIEFGWIDDAMASIRRDFLPADLAPLLNETGIDATVAVQARQSMEETEWLLQLADAYPQIAGVVGWVPLIDPKVEKVLEALSANSKFRGVRHVLQAEPSEYMAREDFNTGVALLRPYSLTYDLLILQHQLPAAIKFVDRLPNQPMVLDHLAKPLIASHEIEPWRAQILELARRPHISCKLSGMVTEADFHNWTIEDLQPYVETALEAFGPERLLFGSDWPVCTVASSYKRWLDVVKQCTAGLSSDEQDKILGENAQKFYGLEEVSRFEEVKKA
jgi:L-fuconolactonase